MTGNQKQPEIERLLVTREQAAKSSADGVMTERAFPAGAAREMVFGRWVIDPDIDLPAHVHSADTIVFCIRGSCSFRVGDDLSGEFEIGSGDYAYIPADTVHTETTGSDGVELVFARDRKGGETEIFEGNE